jgi:hypothetical protein
MFKANENVILKANENVTFSVPPSCLPVADYPESVVHG